MGTHSASLLPGVKMGTGELSGKPNKIAGSSGLALRLHFTSDIYTNIFKCAIKKERRRNTIWFWIIRKKSRIQLQLQKHHKVRTNQIRNLADIPFDSLSPLCSVSNWFSATGPSLSCQGKVHVLSLFCSMKCDF